MDIGIFMPTGTRGYLTSSTAPLNEPSFELNRTVLQAAERYGVEFALCMVKFRGFGGESRYWDGAMEPFTLISALAAVTQRIKLFSTAASLAMPPAVVARMAATIDSVAPGRFGINLVTGWQKAEYEQMGLWPGAVHFERRYDYLDEYVRVMKDLWENGRSDLQGSFFTMRDCRLEPRPAHPIPLVVAGGSDAGLAFAARHCDYNFCAAPDTINEPEAAAAPVERLATAAAAEGRAVKGLIWVSIIAAETDEAAWARWERYKAGTDLVALGWSKSQASADSGNRDPNSTRARVVEAKEPLPTSAMKLIGSHATVAGLLDRMAAVPGVAGAMLSFDDFREGIEAFGQRIQPLMQSRRAIPRVA
jgi:pyrimidine oxygenase